MSEETNLRTPGEADAEAGTDDALTRAALDYHRFPMPGKISVLPTKDMTTQRDLALAYSPGVAAACLAIRDDPIEASNLTSRGNLVAVISNGTAVLGLGNIGALAGKPVMEGKGCLFKKFAGIDVFDIEVDETTERIIGCGIVGPNAGDLIAEAALAIELGADASDIGLTIHPHPTLSETIGMAAEAFEGTITDLYMPKKQAH